MLVERAIGLSQMGLTFPTITGAYRRDIPTALGYLPQLTLADYRAKYERGGIAERIVEAYPKATWSGDIWLRETEDTKITTEFEKEAEKLFARLHAWSRFQRADILAGLGEYSILLIGAPGALSSPLPRVSKPEQIAYLTPVGQAWAVIDKLVDDPSNPRFGLPETYRVTLAAARLPDVVHWTRVIHIAEGVLENEVFGKPRLRAVWNHLDDLLKIIGGGSEATWLRANPGMQIDVDPEIEFGEEEEDSMDAQVDEYEHGFSRTLRTRGTKINMLSAQIAAFGSNATSVLEQIAGTSGIPLRLLLGTERGQLASSQDRDNWSDRVTERRRTWGTPAVSQLTQRMIDCGALPTPKQYEVVWSEIDALNMQAKASVVASLAQGNAASVASTGEPVMTVDEIRATVLNLEPLVGWKPKGDIAEGVADNPDLESEIDDQGLLVDDDGNDEDRDPAGDDLKIRNRNRGAFENVDRAPDEPDWKAIHQVADSYQVAAERVWRAIWRTARETVAARNYQLEYVLSQNNRDAAYRIVETAITEAEALYEPRVTRQLNSITVDAGRAAARNATVRGSLFEFESEQREYEIAQRAASPTSVAFEILFDATDAGAIEFARRHAGELITEVGRDTRLAVRHIITRGLSEGIPPRRLRLLIEQVIGLRSDQVTALENFIARGASASQAKRYAKKLLRDRALLIARTETARAAAYGQQALWMQAASSGLLPPDQKRKWITTLDGRERDEHHEMHGQIRGLQEKFTRPDNGARIEPGQEPNCLLPGSLVSGRFVAGLKAAYTGPAVEIETASGKRLCVTVNHPVVTARGCVAARELRKGDQLLGYGVGVQPWALSNIQHDNSPTSVEDVFQALSLQGLRIAQVGSNHLHGDARWTNGEVEIVGTDRELVGDISSVESAQRGQQVVLSLPNIEHPLVAGLGAGDLAAQRVDTTSAGIPSSATLPLDGGAILAGGLPLQPLCLGPASDLDVVLTQDARERIAVNTEFVRELLERSSGLVSPDEVRCVRQFDFAGHVYDLQTATGWMMAQGIVISNCRCAAGLASAADIKRYEKQVAKGAA